MATRAEERVQLDIARLAALARERGVPPEAFMVQLKERVYRARDRPIGNELDVLMATVVRQAIAEYYGVAERHEAAPPLSPCD